MSTSPVSINTSGGLTSSSTLTNNGATGALQITGLASGINTNELIQAELAEQEMPLTNMQAEISGLNTENQSLSTVQLALQNVSLDALDLGEPSLFFNVQNITSSDPTSVTAATTNGVGAVVGSSTISVSQLASAAQRTFDYTAPTGAETLTIDGQTLSLTAGETAASVASAINHSNSLDVWASASTDSSGNPTLVLSSRVTGNNDNGAGTYINVQDGATQVSGTGTYGQGGYTAGSAGAVLSEVGSLAQEGTDAAYSLNGGTTQYSPTDTVTGALTGVTLTLTAVTSSPVTVTTASPGPDSSAIMSAIQQFVTDYNSAITGMEAQVNTAPASESSPGSYNPYSGSLFGDDQLENLLSNMRDAMYQNGAGLPTGMASLADIGISTGASTGAVTQQSLSGELTINTTELQNAIQTNPNGVQSVLESWAQSFQTLVNASASPGGSIEARIAGNNTLINNLSSQYTTQQQLFTQEEANMEEQWAQVEATLSQLNNQKTSLSSFASSVTSNSSSSSSSG
jgi:flagellar hook-associated protein 2